LSLSPRNRVLVGALAVALTMLVPALPVLAKPGNSLNAKACYKGGWTAMAQANGVTFVSQSECVAHGATGGTYGPPARVFATAFTNVDGIAGFNRSADVLIAELVDSSGDNAINAGDTVVMGSYPTDIVPSSFGTFGVTSHVVTGLAQFSAEGVLVNVGDDSFEWFHGSDTLAIEAYAEYASSDETQIVDTLHASNCNDVGDAILVGTASPSQPSLAVETYDCNASDQGFINVTLNLP
jgi:hypothetical protein